MEKFEIVYDDNLDSMVVKNNYIKRLIAKLLAYTVYFYVLKYGVYILYIKYILNSYVIEDAHEYRNLLRFTILLFGASVILIEKIFSKKTNKDSDENMRKNQIKNAIKLQSLLKMGASIELIENNLVRVKHKYRTYIIALPEGVIDIDSKKIDLTKVKEI